MVNNISKYKIMSKNERRRLYNGQTDGLNLRAGLGVQKFVKKEVNILGSFKRDVYHGRGQYLAKTIFREPWSYEGMFNVNRLEGYGVLSFANNSIFAGLYKDNRPFGPGVFTYSDGRQDVGLWLGSQLIRICTPLGVIDSLCKTPRDRIQVMRYKNLVPIRNKIHDIASEILLQMNASSELLSQAYKLYSRHCKNPASYLFDHMQMDHDFSDLKNVEERLIELTQNEEIYGTYGVNIEIVNITDQLENDSNQLLVENDEVHITWNNRDTITEIMKHSFKHRMQEEEIKFCLRDVLCHRRFCFAAEGVKEKASIEMLLASEKNDSRTILSLLKKYQLNVDVMDNRGNSMILYAAANNAHNVIEMLSEVYCDIDAVNDEGFSPLNHTLTRYLAVLYDVKNWAKGFMSPFDEKEHKGREWLVECGRLPGTRVSPQNMKKNRKTPEGSIQSEVLEAFDDSTRYLFDLRRQSERQNLIKAKNKQQAMKSKSTIDSKSESDVSKSLLDEQQEDESINETLKQEKLKVIEDTIQLLLDLGADVNVSVTPVPVWVLAIFAGNVYIIEKLLKLGVDPNKRLPIDKGILTPLHILVLAKPTKTSSRITELLLQYGADAHSRTNADYWSDLSMFLDEFGSPHHRPQGMNPLHALILRPILESPRERKYLEDVGCLLAWNTDEKELFLGLTPLGLAIAKGNLLMVMKLLLCSKLHINQKFDEFWGNPLTTYMRTQGTNPDTDTYKMLDCLLYFGADPLETNVFNDDENVINFISDYKRQFLESSMASLFFLREKRKKKRKDSEKNDKRKLMVFVAKEAILKNFAKKKVEQYIQGVLVRNVLNCMQQETSEELEEVFHRVMTYIGNWINFGELRELILKNLPVIEFTNGMGIVKGLLMFPEIFPKDLPLPPASKKMTAPFPSLAEGKRARKALGQPDSADEWTKIFQKKLNDIRSTARLHNYCRSTPPEIDKNEELYKVCYECLRRSKNNVLCPKCQLVYLCSMECNKNDIINPRSRHKCKLVFFGLREGDWFVLDPTRAASELFQTSISGESLVKTSLAASAIFEKEEEPAKKSIRKSIKKIDKGIKKSKLKRDVSKVSIVSQGSKTKAKKKGKRKSSVLKSAQKNKTKKPKKRKSISKKKKGRKSKIYKNVKPFSIKGKRQRKRGFSYDLGRRTSGILDSNIFDVIDLLEIKLSQRETKLEEMTKLSTNYQTSETLDIDYNILGGKAKEEEYWDKMEETKYLLEDRLNYFLNLLFNKYGETFDIDNYLPFLIYRNGYLYYKYYKQGEQELVLENYSFN